ncbi:MAG: ribonuclease III [Pyrinomonadaceae bacterium]
MRVALGSLEAIIGHKFSDVKLLERAVTHRSWAYENLPGETEENVRSAENESMEFIGDSVLGLVIAEQLFLRNPTLSEGDLTLMKHNLVSGSALATLSESIGLGEFLRLGGSEIKSGRRKQSLLTNAFEAVIGAVFLDSGYIAARVVITRLMEERLQSVTPEASIDFKSRLQTELQSQKQKTAIYNLLKTDGPPHARTFFVEVTWDNGKAKGEGNSIKAAEMMAAAEALNVLSDQNKPEPKRTRKK